MSASSASSAAAPLPVVPPLASGWSVDDWNDVALPCLRSYAQLGRTTESSDLPRGGGPQGVSQSSADGYCGTLGEYFSVFFPHVPADTKALPAYARLAGLEAGIKVYHAKAYSRVPPSNATPWFLRVLLPRIVAWAAEYPYLSAGAVNPPSPEETLAAVTEDVAGPVSTRSRGGGPSPLLPRANAVVSLTQVAPSASVGPRGFAVAGTGARGGVPSSPATSRGRGRGGRINDSSNSQDGIGDEEAAHRDVPVWALPLLEPTTTGSADTAVATVSRRLARSVLALAFLGLGVRPFLHSLTIFRGRADMHALNTRDYDVGEIDWLPLFRADGPGAGVGPQRIACQLHYFDAWCQGELRAARAAAGPSAAPSSPPRTASASSQNDGRRAASAQSTPAAAMEEEKTERLRRSDHSTADNNNLQSDPQALHWDHLAPEGSLPTIPQSLSEPLTFYRTGLTSARTPPDWTELRTPIAQHEPLPPEWYEAAETDPIVRPEPPRPLQHAFGTPLIEQFDDAEAHVDFANRQVQIGKIIPSCTQEEVMFSIRPELFLTLAVYTTLLDHEAAGVAGAATFASYTGYLGTFRYAGSVRGGDGHPLNSVTKQRAETGVDSRRRIAAAVDLVNVPFVVIMDAHVNMGAQFLPAMHRRDLNKAFVAFDLAYGRAASSVIATGPWGCGAFGGDVGLKWMQQLMAASAASFALEASTVGRFGRASTSARDGDDDHAEQQQQQRGIALRYHDSRLAGVLAGLTGLMALLDVTVADCDVWVNDFGLYHTDTSPMKAYRRQQGSTTVAAHQQHSTDGRRGEAFDVDALAVESQDTTKWPSLPGEDPALVTPPVGREKAEVDESLLVPNTMAWYWSLVVEGVQDGVVPATSFLAYVTCRVGERVKTYAELDAQGGRNRTRL